MLRSPHSRLLVVAAAAALVVAACSSSSAGRTSTTPSAPNTSPTVSTSDSTPASDVQVIKVAWTNGKAVAPSDRIAVKLGAKVQLEVTSDVDEIVHVHLNDAEQDVKAGATVVFTFTADKPGIFDVEVHKADKLLVQLQVS